MAALPYMQFYVNDYIADTMHLTTEEHGAYILLIMHYWTQGEPLEDTNGNLERVTRLTKNRWKKVKKNLKNYFEITPENFWIHARIEDDLLRAGATIKQRRAAGIASAAARKRSADAACSDDGEDLNGTEQGNDRSTGVATNSATPVEFSLQRKGQQNPTSLSLSLSLSKKSNPPPPSGAPPPGEELASDESALVSNHSPPVNKPPAKTTTPAKRKTRIPTGFELTDRMRDNAINYWVQRERWDLDPDEQFDEFVTHYTSNGETRADWQATWKTWYVKSIKFNRRPTHEKHSRSNQPCSPVERLIAEREERERRERGNVYEHDPDPPAH